MIGGDSHSREQRGLLFEDSIYQLEPLLQLVYRLEPILNLLQTGIMRTRQPDFRPIGPLFLAPPISKSALFDRVPLHFRDAERERGQ